MKDKVVTVKPIDGVNFVEREIPLGSGRTITVPGLTVRALLKALQGADPDAMVTYVFEAGDQVSFGSIGGAAFGERLCFLVGPEVSRGLNNWPVVPESGQGAPPVDRSAKTTTDGSPYDPSNPNGQTGADGQHQRYVVLSEAERAKGFVRPVRDAYRHVGIRPTFPVRDLTPAEQSQYAGMGYVKYEEYPEGARSLGRFWTNAQLRSGCGKVTTMGRALAETYARDPGFYGSTFCSTCGKHLPVGEDGEFIWYENDGSDGPRVGA